MKDEIRALPIDIDTALFDCYDCDQSSFEYMLPESGSTTMTIDQDPSFTTSYNTTTVTPEYPTMAHVMFDVLIDLLWFTTSDPMHSTFYPDAQYHIEDWVVLGPRESRIKIIKFDGAFTRGYNYQFHEKDKYVATRDDPRFT